MLLHDFLKFDPYFQLKTKTYLKITTPLINISNPLEDGGLFFSFVRLGKHND